MMFLRNLTFVLIKHDSNRLSRTINSFSLVINLAQLCLEEMLSIDIIHHTFIRIRY